MAMGWQDGINRFVNWYYQPSNSKFDYEVKQFARSLPIIGGLFQAGDNANRMEDYMRNRGLSWSDVRYNGTPFGSTYGGGLANATVSAMNLYRSASRKPSARQKDAPTFYSGARPRGGWSSNNVRYHYGHDRYHNNRTIPHKKF